MLIWLLQPAIAMSNSSAPSPELCDWEEWNIMLSYSSFCNCSWLCKALSLTPENKTVLTVAAVRFGHNMDLRPVGRNLALKC
uniref:Uncharacterized protein n=1 Tax=Setaria viridis TaxID=4556 RepID=A0A4U6VKY3_SETVI|nr:hypothetical protein SEVIR_3G358750v2 [Setaria viridis]